MELNDLKRIWQQEAQPVGNQKLSGEELQTVLRHKTGDLLASLRRSLLFEYLFTIACFAVALWFVVFAPRTDMRVLAAFAVLMCVFFGWYYHNQLKLLRKVQLYSGDVKSEITALHSRLSMYLKYYQNTYRILVPISFMAGMVVGGGFAVGDTFIKLLQRPLIVAGLVALTLLFIFISDKVIAWYLHKLYGRHMSRLQDVMNQLDEG